MRLVCARRRAHAGMEDPSGNPITLCQPAHTCTVGQAPLFPWCHLTGEIIVCGVRRSLHSAGVILQKKCDCVDEISNIYSRSFRINFATESIIDATGLLLSIVNATALGATFGVFFEKKGFTDSESH